MSDTVITILRISIWLTFLMTVVGVPYLIIRLNRFIGRYEKAHMLLSEDVRTVQRQQSDLQTRIERLEGRDVSR